MTGREQLTTPLAGRSPQKPRRTRSSRPLVAALLAGAAILGIGAAVGLSRLSKPPTASAVIEKTKPAEKPAATLAQSDADESGVKVVRGSAPAAPSSGQWIQVPPEKVGAQPSDMEMAAAPDPRLVEQGRYGPLPKVAADGATPFDVYRRPAVQASGPKLAIVMTGMGLNPSLTASAVGLPAPVSFAFASVGKDLWAQAAAARRQGHELLDETPMAAAGAPELDRWPHELSAGAGAARNLSDLRWSLAQFPGYFGVINFRGGGFLSDRGAFEPVLEELAARGLAFVDDGSAGGSLTAELASSLGLRSATADAAIDGSGGAEAVSAWLDRLINQAQSKGSAIGTAPGLPVVIAGLSGLGDRLAAAGVTLVPVSELTNVANARQRPPAP